MRKDRHRKSYNKLIDEVGKCELCGSTRGLEAHHVIPIVAQFAGIDLDTEDNIIICCSSCHAKLTNRKLLTKYGIEKTKLYDKMVELHREFYEMIEDDFSSCDILDCFDQWGENARKYILENNNI